MHLLAGESAVRAEVETLQWLLGCAKKLRSGGGGGSPEMVCVSVSAAAQPKTLQTTVRNMSRNEGIGPLCS